MRPPKIRAVLQMCPGGQSTLSTFHDGTGETTFGGQSQLSDSDKGGRWVFDGFRHFPVGFRHDFNGFRQRIVII
jgi:hypothetical protein